MRPANWLLALAGISLFGSVALPRYVPAPLRPDLFAVLTVFVALRARPEQALALGWFAGLASDLLSGGALGGAALGHLFAAAAILRMRRLVDPRAALTQVMVGILAGLLAGAGHAMGTAIAAGVVPSPGVLLGSALATGLATPICVAGLRRTAAWTGT